MKVTGYSKAGGNVFRDYVVDRQIMGSQLLSCHRVWVAVGRLSVQLCQRKLPLTHLGSFCPPQLPRTVDL